MVLKEFVVNNYIKLQLEEEKTVIYVGNREFWHCTFLLLNIPIEKISSFDEIESVDEASQKLDKSLEMKQGQIPPEVEFWGHCSNLQIWAEYDYDARLLHSNLAFPLLRELTKFGDPQAKKVFKDEIFKRFSSGFYATQQFLIEHKYLDYLTSEERETLFKIAPMDRKIRRQIKHYKGDVNLFLYCSRDNPWLLNAISYINLDKFGVKVYYGCIFIDDEIFGFKFILSYEDRIIDFYIIYEGNSMYIDREAENVYGLEARRFLRVKSFDYFTLNRCEEVLTDYLELIPTEDKYARFYHLDLSILDTAFRFFLNEEGKKNYFLKTDQFDLDIIKYLKQSKYFKKNYFNSEYGDSLLTVLKYL